MTSILDPNTMTDKERVTALINNHIVSVKDETREAYGEYGKLVLNVDNPLEVREARDKCKTLEGQVIAFECALGLIEGELG